MKKIGLDISHHTPKMADQYLGEEWDYVITVCDHANETCPAFLGKVKHLLISLLYIPKSSLLLCGFFLRRTMLYVSVRIL